MRDGVTRAIALLLATVLALAARAEVGNSGGLMAKYAYRTWKFSPSKNKEKSGKHPLDFQRSIMIYFAHPRRCTPK